MSDTPTEIGQVVHGVQHPTGAHFRGQRCQRLGEAVPDRLSLCLVSGLLTGLGGPGRLLDELEVLVGATMVRRARRRGRFRQRRVISWYTQAWNAAGSSTLGSLRQATSRVSWVASCASPRSDSIR